MDERIQVNFLLPLILIGTELAPYHLVQKYATDDILLCMISLGCLKIAFHLLYITSPSLTALGNLPVSKSVGSLNGDNGASWDSEFNYNPKP